MLLTDVQQQSLRDQLGAMHDNCLYSAQAYFEASKRAELWGRFMVFIPACVSAVSGFMTSFGSKNVIWGALAAVAGAIAATASFLGTTKKSTDYLTSARSYTALRHRVNFELRLLSTREDFAECREIVEQLNSDYLQIVSSDIPVPNRSFNLASKRIEQGSAS